VDHLERCAEIGCAGWDFSGTCDHAGGFHAEDGAEAFAAGEDAVAHGSVDGVGQGVGRREEAFKGRVSELYTGLQQGLYVGMHVDLMINERG
jgi:hypothetical protein